MKQLQFGPSKCIKMHIGRTCIETLCKDVDVFGWKVEVKTDTKTGEVSRHEYFAGQENMKEKGKWMGKWNI